MAGKNDATKLIRKCASELPNVKQGSSCNQSSFKAGSGSFLFIGPGPRGKGFKAMFKLDRLLKQAEQLAAKHPDRFQIGKTGWVTVRFSNEEPLQKSIWEKWLKESYRLCTQRK